MNTTLSALLLLLLTTTTALAFDDPFPDPFPFLPWGADGALTKQYQSQENPVYSGNRYSPTNPMNSTDQPGVFVPPTMFVLSSQAG